MTMFMGVSIHAPAWGATCGPVPAVCCLVGFNPRARVGRDDHRPRESYQRESVSIHAPAWGATLVRGRLPTST